VSRRARARVNGAGWPGRAGETRLAHNDRVRIQIHASDLPGTACGPGPDAPGGHHNIHVGVQGRKGPGELLGLVPGDEPSVTWDLDCTAVRTQNGVDLKGPHILGPPGRRFIYLTWGTLDEARGFTMFRRAKLMLDAIDPAVIGDAVAQGRLVGRLGLTDPKGNPLCAAVRPPVIEWSAVTAR
jgi:hypothetical protein